MKDFFEDLEVDIKQELSEVYTEMLTIREHRGALLEQYRVDRVEYLKEKIESGEISEHPAYDHYLAILSLNKELEPLREQCRVALEEG